ncbi:hypothetical protein DFJ63DRAFT_334556 [Scheffersomyces coipomensis]|uniref:uncharacterized protein n=1 Tax=Scheffersomyces coipomensis TaxID=1788519 RepID=UPI00315C6B4E
MSIDQPENVNSTSLDQVDGVFNGVEYDSSPIIRTPPEYPEAILQQTDKANRLYSSFQSHNKQFVTSNKSSSNLMVRWNDSFIDSTQRLIVDSWTGADQKGMQKTSKTISKANSLFSWSSTDAYIAERKRQLKLSRSLKSKSNDNKTDEVNHLKVEKESEETSEDVKRKKELKKLHIKVSSTSTTNKLSRIVENESNKFIHARIQMIKAHHSEQINQEIHDRKKRDHETYLRKLKMKEAEYERELLEATLNREKHSFFSTLFGFNATTSKGDSDAQSRTSIDSETSVATSTNQTSVNSKNKRFSFLPVVSIWGSQGSSNGKIRSNDSLTVKKESKPDHIPGSNGGSPSRPTTPKIVISEAGAPDAVESTPQTQVDEVLFEDEEGSEDEEFSEFASTPPPTNSRLASPVKQDSPKSGQSPNSYKFMSIDDTITAPTSKINTDLVDFFDSTSVKKQNTTNNDINDDNLVNL